MRCLALLLLVAAASADDLSLANGYLPPPRACPEAKTVTETNTKVVTRTVVKPVVRSDVRYVTVPVVQTSVVPSQIVRQSVRQVPTYVYKNVLVTDNQVKVSTRVQEIPAETKLVQQTVRKAEQRVVYKTAYQTVYKTVVVPTTLTKVNVKTQVNVETEYVPQYRVAYKTEYVAGPTQVLTQTEQVVNTRVQRVPQPDVYRTKYETATTRVLRSEVVPGPTVYSSVNVYKTNVETKTEVRYSNVYVTYTEQQQVPVLKTVTQTKTDTRVVQQTDVKTKYVPRYYTKTQLVNVPQPVTVTNTEYVTKTLKAYPIVKTVQQTKQVVQTLPGAVKQLTKYQVVTKTVTDTVRSTRVVPQYQVKTETVKEPCGYSYPEPSNPFRF